jgi:hypothetical protein
LRKKSKGKRKNFYKNQKERGYVCVEYSKRPLEGDPKVLLWRLSISPKAVGEIGVFN